MAPVSVNTLDWNDWDDTVLLQDWNEAFAEYEKYHSIYQSGKSLEEALTREELELVTEELMGQDLDSTNDGAETEVHMREEDGEIKTGDEMRIESLADADDNSYMTREAIPIKSEDQTTVTKANAPGTATFSATRDSEGTLEGEALQNMIQAYYWAGYYKGLYEGLQQAKGASER